MYTNFKLGSFFKSLPLFLCSFFVSEINAQTHTVNSPETNLLLSTYTNDRKYNEVCWLTAHNAFASAEDGWYYKQQNLGFQKQYELGVRSFMIDLYWYQSGQERPIIAMCHERTPNISCSFSYITKGLTPPTSLYIFLSQVKNWLEIHNDENNSTIITLHFESYLKNISWANENNVTEELNGQRELETLFNNLGLSQYLHTPMQSVNYAAKIKEWETLGEMRKSNRRLVVFSDKGNGLIHTSSYRETQYDLSTYPNCEMRRDNRDSQKQFPLFVFNHFYPFSISPFNNYIAINSYENIMQRVTLCSTQQEQSRLPNFIAVDFVELGQDGGARRVVTELNQKPTTEFHSPTQPPANPIDTDIKHDEL